MRKLSKNRFILIYFSFWFLYFLYFWINAITKDLQGNLLVRQANMWADWAIHFTMGSSMATRSLILEESPLLLNANFSYPFISNLISAILIKLNYNFFQSFILPSFIFSLTLIFALFYFYKTLSKSKIIAITASLIFLLNGGTGFIYYINDIKSSEHPIKTIINPPQKYTNIESKHYRWISVINSMVIPQRSFSLGFSLSLISLVIIYQEFFYKKKNNKKNNNRKKKIPLIKLFAVGSIIGLMPIIHTHSFLALFIILFFWLLADLLKKPKIKNKDQTTTMSFFQKLYKWIFIIIIVSIISLPLIYKFLFSNIENSFIKWYPGWYLNIFKNENFFTFWFKNWGITPLISITGLGILIKKSKQKLNTFFIYFPFFFIFIVINLFLFQPFIWDNTKLLVWSSLGISLLSAITLKQLWLLKMKHYKFITKLFTIVIFTFMIFSGAIDTYRTLKFNLHSYVMYNSEELSISNWVKNNTNKNSIWITGNYHNNWLFNLTGRQALMTYPGWLWTQGYNYQQIELDYEYLFSHPKSTDIIDKYSLDYVVIGPFEKSKLQANYKEFATNYKLVKQTKNISIFKFSHLPN